MGEKRYAESKCDRCGRMGSAAAIDHGCPNLWGQIQCCGTMRPWSPPPPAQRVVCAAIRLDGHLICGPRHFDGVMRTQAKAIGLKPPFAGDQGFVDQHGRYLTRAEAWPIAKAAGQVIREVGGNDRGELFSENLY